MTSKLIVLRLILTIICNKYNLAPEFDDLVHKLMNTLHQKRANLALKDDNLAPKADNLAPAIQWYQSDTQ